MCLQTERHVSCPGISPLVLRHLLNGFDSGRQFLDSPRQALRRLFRHSPTERSSAYHNDRTGGGRPTVFRRRPTQQSRTASTIPRVRAITYLRSNSMGRRLTCLSRMFNSHSPWNVSAGHAADLTALTQHYEEQQRVQEEERVARQKIQKGSVWDMSPEQLRASKS
jgi:hypothetical protein